MGMVFATRRTCIEPEELTMILEDDEYRSLPTDEEPQLGDVIVYRGEDGSVTHAGLVAALRINLEDASRELTILSQWGSDGEYFHRPEDVNPRLGTPAEYYTDRRGLEASTR